MKKGIVVVLLCLVSIFDFGRSKMDKVVDKGYIRLGTTIIFYFSYNFYNFLDIKKWLKPLFLKV